MKELQVRFAALEQEVRFWRSAVGVLVVVGLLLLSSQPGVTQTTIDQRVAALEAKVADLQSKTAHIKRVGNDVYITGANLHLRNGLGATNGLPADPGNTNYSTTKTNGLGNLILGYFERRNDGSDRRSGSHNLIVGPYHNFGSYGGLVVGSRNEITKAYASVSGGQANTAYASFASIIGGVGNNAYGDYSAVSGGARNWADGPFSAVSGGVTNLASGYYSAVSGGERNLATGWVSSVSGGYNNSASGSASSASGGTGIGQTAAYGWSAGTTGTGVYTGRFRSP